MRRTNIDAIMKWADKHISSYKQPFGARDCDETNDEEGPFGAAMNAMDWPHSTHSHRCWDWGMGTKLNGVTLLGCGHPWGCQQTSSRGKPFLRMQIPHQAATPSI
eukprot:scaffold108460_cov17-Prasinocladus_malaysianus.AAC.1